MKIRRICPSAALLAFLAAACGGSGGPLDPCAKKTALCQTQSELRCSQDGKSIEVCQKDDDGCLVWQKVEDCADQGKSCDPSGPSCVSQCQDRCGQLDALRCQDNVLQRCQPAAAGCLDWVVSQDCASKGQLCEDTDGQPGCKDCFSECSAGTRRCVGNLLQECAQVAVNCWKWKLAKDCSQDGEFCNDKEQPPACVTICGNNGDCAQTSYCYKGSCTNDTGYCRGRPTNCSDQENPVCGCDGKIYLNACVAAAEGVNLDNTGLCDTTCHSNDDCESNQFCRLSSCTAETGKCATKPTTCPENMTWNPVCGCDQKDYPTFCHAEMAGMNIDHRGLCDGSPCFDNGLCAPASFCNMEECRPDQGVCELVPLTCPTIDDPVCGCDGTTFRNACYAAMARVSVSFKGACPKICYSNNDCSESEYCELQSCNAKSGLCEARPQQCSNVREPVCGCDGKTYPNFCWASFAGVNVDRPGECNSPTCKSNENCTDAPNMYCYKKSCADETGWCVARPTGCNLPLYLPVCACSGKSYNNDCQARYAGENINYWGKCVGESCFAEEGCYSNQLFCNFVPCSIETGKCQRRPESCELVWQPVCGCDQSSYANACVANFLGESVDHNGTCQ